MKETVVDLKTPDGTMATHVFDPTVGKRKPVVIFYMDGIGIRDTLVEMARRIASNGYTVALPNLFYRSGAYAPFKPADAFTNPEERARLMALIKEVTPSRALSDTTVMIEWLDRSADADAHVIGTVGYCMGGGPAIRAAGAFPDRVRAAASYHGGRLATDAPDSPHLLASKSRGRVYVGYAENDESFPEAQRQRLEEALTGGRVPHTLELYHARHGFSMPDLPAYDKDAADRHWETLLSLFRESLGTSPSR